MAAISLATDVRRNPVTTELHNMVLDDALADTSELDVAGLSFIEAVRIIVPSSRGIDPLLFAEVDATVKGELINMKRAHEQTRKGGVATGKLYVCRYNEEFKCPHKVRIKTYPDLGGKTNATKKAQASAKAVQKLVECADDIRELCNSERDITFDTTRLSMALAAKDDYNLDHPTEIVVYGGEHNCSHKAMHTISASHLVTFAQMKCKGGFPDVRKFKLMELQALFGQFGLPTYIHVGQHMWYRCKEKMIMKVSDAVTSGSGAISTARCATRRPKTGAASTARSALRSPQREPHLRGVEGIGSK